MERILVLIREAFLLRPGDEWTLLPDDKLSAIYEAAYPNPQLSVDALEYNVLFEGIGECSGLNDDELERLWKSDPAVKDVVDLCMRQ